jgi:CheY-like chemotaxis protein
VPTILAIDDDEIFQILVRRIFEPVEIQVVSAYTSDEGLELALQADPSLILVDIRLPGTIGDGWVLAGMIQEYEHLRNIPIVMVSASGGMGSQPPDAVEYAGYFSKPFKVDVFRDFIIQMLR